MGNLITAYLTTGECPLSKPPVEDKEKALWRQQISLSCAKEVSAPLMGKLLMWPFEKVLWWCCRAKDIPRDRHHIRNTAQYGESGTAGQCARLLCIQGVIGRLSYSNRALDSHTNTRYEAYEKGSKTFKILYIRDGYM